MRSLSREAIKATLAQRAGNAPDADAIAEATVYTWTQVSAQLVPVIGPVGVNVLLNRALHQIGHAFPWLATVEDHGDDTAPLASLKARFSGQETATVTEASTGLLLNFTELLTTLIGESLTEQLLSPVWAPPPVSGARTGDSTT